MRRSGAVRRVAVRATIAALCEERGQPSRRRVAAAAAWRSTACQAQTRRQPRDQPHARPALGLPWADLAWRAAFGAGPQPLRLLRQRRVFDVGIDLAAPGRDSGTRFLAAHLPEAKAPLRRPRPRARGLRGAPLPPGFGTALVHHHRRDRRTRGYLSTGRSRTSPLMGVWGVTMAMVGFPWSRPQGGGSRRCSAPCRW